MLDLVKDVQSLSHFKRYTAQMVRQMKETGNPVLLTIDGKAEVVVQDAAAYQRLLAVAERAEMIQFLRDAKADAEAGRIVPARKFLESLGSKKQAKKA